MKFVVKEFLSARFVGYPAGADQAWPLPVGQFPIRVFFEFSWQRFGEDSRRTRIPKATAKSLIRFNSRYFWPFVASNDGGVRRAFTAGKEIQRPTRTMRGEPDHLRVARWRPRVGVPLSWAIPAAPGWFSP